MEAYEITLLAVWLSPAPFIFVKRLMRSTCCVWLCVPSTFSFSMRFVSYKRKYAISSSQNFLFLHFLLPLTIKFLLIHASVLLFYLLSLFPFFFNCSYYCSIPFPPTSSSPHPFSCCWLRIRVAELCTTNYDETQECPGPDGCRPARRETRCLNLSTSHVQRNAIHFHTTS
jgi:hypothetical protein